DFSPRGFVRFSKCILQNLRGANRNIKNNNNVEYWTSVKNICLEYLDRVPNQANLYTMEIDPEDENTFISIIEIISMTNIILQEESQSPKSEEDIILTNDQLEAMLKI
ncbi:MAG: hypothetical protein ACRCU6_01110, partial [Fusobacteriaceae bacterium]